MAKVEAVGTQDRTVLPNGDQSAWDAAVSTQKAGVNQPGDGNQNGGPLPVTVKAAVYIPPPANKPSPNDGWKQLTGEDNPQALNAMQQIYDHWDQWGFHQGVTFKVPADADVNPDAKPYVEFLASNPGVIDAWSKYSGDSGGKLTKDGLGKFLSDYKSDINSAASAYKTFLRNNPNATDAEKNQARQLAIVGANQSIIKNGDKYIDASHLTNFASNNPNFSKEVTDAAKTWSDPTLLARVDNAGYSYGQSKPDGLFDIANVKSYLQNERVTGSDASLWGTLGSDDGDRELMNKPLDTSEQIYNHWDQWGFHEGVNFQSPADGSVDPAAKSYVEFAGQNPALVAAWDKNHDNIITKDEVGDFINATKADVKTAEAAYADYLKKNPNADPASKELARSAALVAANRYLIGQGSDYLNSGQLSKFADSDVNNHGIAHHVFSAAKLMSNPGVLRQFDIAGNNPADTKYDGTIGVENVKQWLANSAPKDITEFANFLNAAATSSLVDGVDTSKVGPDVFTDPSKYDGKTKAAVLMQLIDAYSTFDAGLQSELWNPFGRDGLNGNKDKVKADLEAKIAQLSGDADVKKYLADGRTQALQDIVNSDITLSYELGKYYDGTFSSGAGFNDILAKKDDKGNPIALDQAVQNFVITGQILHSALGRTGNPDLQGILTKSGNYDKVQQYYLDNIVTGKSLTDALNGGNDVQEALTGFYADVAAFNSVLDPKTVSDNATKLDSNTIDIVSDKLFGTGTWDQIRTAFADGSGNLDEAKLRSIIEQAQKDNPDLFKDSTGAQIQPDAIVSAFRGVFDDVRQGAKITDALTKLEAISKQSNGVMTAYSKGVFHLVSALFMGGVLSARTAQNGTTPQAQAGKVSAGFQLAGLLLEGSSKYTKSVDAASRPLGNWLTDANLGKIENYGKLIGGVGSVLAGGFGIASGVNSLNQGDKVGGGLSLAGGLLGIISGLTSGAEAIASLTGSGLAAGLGLASGILGVVGGLFAAGLVIGLSIWEVVKHANQQDAFYANLSPVLQQYGINGGPMTDSDYPDIVPTGGGV